MGNIFTHWESVINFTRNDIVFERQNKKYGAYVIRKYYPERLRNAFIYSLLAMILLFGIPLLLQKFNPAKTNIIIPKTDHIIFVNPVLPQMITTVPAASPHTKKATTEGARYKVQDALVPVDNSQPEQQQISYTQPISAASVSVVSVPAALPPDDGAITEPEPVLFAPVMPEFAGGNEALDRFLMDRIKYPRQAIDEGISGSVYVTFVIDTKGKVTRAAIARGIAGGELLEQEALRVIRLMPYWKPGMNGDRPVPVQVTIPITFVLR